MKNNHNSEVQNIKLKYGIEINPEMEKTFNEMIINVTNEPLSHFFNEELSLFQGCKMTSIVGYDEMVLKSINLLDDLAVKTNNIDIKGLVITCSDLDLEIYHKLKKQIDLLPEQIICIVYGGVKLTSNNNQVEIFVFQQNHTSD